MEAARRHGPWRMNEQCSFVRSDLTCDEALAVLDPFFIAVREVFVAYEMRWSGSSRMRRVRIECAPWVHDTPRHFAGATEDGRCVLVTPELAELPEPTVAAILAHEFGHAMDFAYPGVFKWTPDGIVRPRPAAVLKNTEDKRLVQAAVANARQWRDRDTDTVERTADAVAEHVTGRAIGYTGPCLLQTLDAGMPRPAGLR